MLFFSAFRRFYKNNTNQATNNYWINYLYTYQPHISFFYILNANKTTLLPLNLTNNISYNFNIFFLKKEVFYTKLKYSRVPQFDTSSGAAASFLSGLYGFMVCEKFGFELIDSGDFLFIFMYVFFFCLIVTSLVSVFNSKHTLFASFII